MNREEIEAAKEQAQSRRHYLIVYGTLRRGQGNSSTLEGSKFVGTIVIDADQGFVMVDPTEGSFPALVRAKSIGQKPHSIIAEVYKVDDDTLRRIDKLEGTPYMYQRRRIEVRVRGRDVKAWVYIGNPKFFDLEEASVINDGDWKRYDNSIRKKENDQRDKQIEGRATIRRGEVSSSE